jgi:hypothetical protein
MKYFVTVAIAALALAGWIVAPANALLLSVSGPNSSAGTAPAIIAAPAHALDDIVTNTGMEGFDEAQDVVTTVAHGIDGGGVIPIGTAVDSHMIFLNSEGTAVLDHFNVIWTFAGTILGVMSDQPGNLEAASTFELGAPGTNYTVPFPGSGPAAPYPARGLETNVGPGGPDDGYAISGNQITVGVGMHVTEPGDWIRVVTAAEPIPEPTTIILMGFGLLGVLGIVIRQRCRKK